MPKTNKSPRPNQIRLPPWVNKVPIWDDGVPKTIQRALWRLIWPSRAAQFQRLARIARSPREFSVALVGGPLADFNQFTYWKNRGTQFGNDGSGWGQWITVCLREDEFADHELQRFRVALYHQWLQQLDDNQIIEEHSRDLGYGAADLDAIIRWLRKGHLEERLAKAQIKLRQILQAETQINRSPAQSETSDSAVDEPRRPRQKRSTVKDEAKEKLAAALTSHHKYDGRSCLRTEPIGNNDLARKAEVAPSTASAFFTKQFGGHRLYRAICLRNVGKLIDAIKTINAEWTPRELLHRFQSNRLLLIFTPPSLFRRIVVSQRGHNERFC